MLNFRSIVEIAAAIDVAKASGAAALNVLSSGMFFGFRQIIFKRASVLRLPAIYEQPDMAQEGGLIACGPTWVHIARDIYARQAVQLLRGTKVVDVPVEHVSLACRRPLSERSGRPPGGRRREGQSLLLSRSRS
jgi:putative tryptophan/tyrosine transport system substrate-binding protein